MVKLSKSSLLYGAKGKIAGQTVYTDGGETIMRKGDTNAKDANTLSQRVQRVIMKTVAKNYQTMKALADHSFEGYAIGRDCMNRFRHVNSRKMRMRAAEIQAAGGSLYDYYNFLPLGSEEFQPAAVILAEGTLPKVQGMIAGEKGAFALSANTYKALIDQYNLQRGDQLTFVTVESDEGYMTFNYARVILDPRETDGDVAPLTTAFIESSAVVKPSARNKGAFASLSYEDSKVKFSLGSGTVVACGIIVSRKFEGQWYRSFCQLVLSETNLGSAKTSLMAAAEETSASVDIDVESEQFLNNAGTSASPSPSEGGESNGGGSSSGSGSNTGGSGTNTAGGGTNTGGGGTNTGGGDNGDDDGPSTEGN